MDGRADHMPVGHCWGLTVLVKYPMSTKRFSAGFRRKPVE
jgi:hypothetical protein